MLVNVHMKKAILLLLIHLSYCSNKTKSLVKNGISTTERVSTQPKFLIFRGGFIPVMKAAKSDKNDPQLKFKAKNNKPKSSEENPDTLLQERPDLTTSEVDAAEISTPKKLIIGGTRAAPGRFPWQVYIEMDGLYICGGSLIGPRSVLTAAHCAHRMKVFACNLGGTDRMVYERGEVTIVSTNVSIHEKFDAVTLNNDIAIVHLNISVNFTTNIQPVRLPTYIDELKTFAFKKVIASGYGIVRDDAGVASLYLNQVELETITNAACFKLFGKSVIVSTICTAADALKSICSGDSGGPLVINGFDGNYTLIGIISFGAAMTCAKYPAGYVRVTSFLRWISTKTGIYVRYV